MRITEADRKAAKAERTNSKRPMSASKVAALRAINEHEQATRKANQNFATVFQQMPKDTRTMMELLERICPGQLPEQLRERMANKVRWGLAQGWTASEPHHVLFFGTLTSEEEGMADEQFLRSLEATWPRSASVSAEPSTEHTKVTKRQRASKTARERVWTSVEHEKLHHQAT
jgi:hypothetical protein